MGDDELSNGFRDKLQQDLDGIQSALATITDSYNECLKYYSDTLHRLTEGPYESPNDLIQLHQNTKNEARAQVQRRIKSFRIKVTAKDFLLSLFCNSMFNRFEIFGIC